LEGAPSIPLQSVFFEINPDQIIDEITIRPGVIQDVYLEKELIPLQKPYPLSRNEEVEFIYPDREFYEATQYPETLLYSYGQGLCGNTTIGYVSFFSGYYSPQELKMEIPNSFDLEIEFSENETINRLPAGNIPDEILRNLGIQPELREDENTKYLLITTAEFLEHFQPLLNWRSIQGISVNAITIDDIQLQFEGRDLQEKIRNCIIYYYENSGISYVTLGGDVDHIPDRKVFAFDCEFGAYDDENEIPSDMYYSCLHGNWDANGNDIFGEDQDETDYFPEVFVGRIPVNSISEVADYIDRLIIYETGGLENYNKAVGFSMELWTGSNSEICQQYIYDMYFPEYYSIDFNYGDDNNQEDAYQLMNEGQNIIQHTGHAGKQAMSLENGSIRVTELDTLQNEWGGIFYSIGCWSAAIDYNSIGENLVSQLDKGFLGYIGNSRYGWGAPSAPGFGFSEFFQKEFFKELFNGHTKLAEINALQKLEFIPFYSGVSVYKWVAYQLNALGDSYFNINIHNPNEIDYTIQTEEDNILIYISSEGIPLNDVAVSANDHLVFSDETGLAVIPIDITGDSVTLYKQGYEAISINMQEIDPSLFLDIDRLPQIMKFTQGEELSFIPELHNNLQQDIDFQVLFDYNPNEIELSFLENPDFALAGSSVELSQVNVRIKQVSENNQMKNGKKIFINLKIVSPENELLTERSILLTISAPSITISNFQYNIDEILPGLEFPFEFSLFNNGEFDIQNIEIAFSSNSGHLIFQDQIINSGIWLNINEQLNLNNNITIDPGAPENFSEGIEIQISADHNNKNFEFHEIVYIASGRINLEEDFEDINLWSMDPQWVTVNNFYFSEFNSLSCRPEFIGIFNADSPLMSYIPGMELSFYYKYKMPMYGEDGVYIILEPGPH